VRYMLMIYGSDRDWTQADPAELRPVLEGHIAFSDDLRKANAYVAAEALQTSESTTTVQIQDGEALLTDGPYIETKEQIAGFYLVESDDYDQVLEWAKRLAKADGGPIEVRPVKPAHSKG
jgi:hypothetical protein